MKYTVLTLFILFIAQNPYAQTKFLFKIKGVSQTECIIGHEYYPEDVCLDTLKISDEDFAFSFEKSIPRGMYFVRFANQGKFRFFYDGKAQALHIKSDMNDLQGKLKVKNSTDNKVLVSYWNKEKKLKEKYKKVRGQDEELTALYQFREKIAGKTKEPFAHDYIRMCLHADPYSISTLVCNDVGVLYSKEYYTHITNFVDNSPFTYQLDKLLQKFEDRPQFIKHSFPILNQHFQEKGRDELLIHLLATWAIPNKQGFFSEEELLSIVNREDSLSFLLAKKKNTELSYKDYISKHPKGKYIGKAGLGIEKLSFQKAQKANNKQAYQEFLKEYPEGVLKDDAWAKIEGFDFAEAKKKHTLAAYSSFLDRYPNGKQKANAEKAIQNKKRELEQERLRKLEEERRRKQLEFEKAEAKRRQDELLAASKIGVDAMVEFVDKYPECEESVVATKILKRYNATQELISHKVYVADKFYWIAEGNRHAFADLFETSRDFIKGGKNYNVFSFVKLRNKTEKKLNLKVDVHLNMVSSSQLLLMSSSSVYKKTRTHYISLQGGETKAFLVLYPDISGNMQIGGLLGYRKATGINSMNPVSISIKEHKTPFDPEVIARQDKLMEEVIKNKGNITVHTKSGEDALREWMFGSKYASQVATLRVYYTDKQRKSTCIVYDAGTKVAERDFESGSGSESFLLPKNRTYIVKLPGHEYKVMLKPPLTHLVISDDYSSEINYEDTK